jgi:hypothetical protein
MSKAKKKRETSKKKREAKNEKEKEKAGQRQEDLNVTPCECGGTDHS